MAVAKTASDTDVTPTAVFGVAFNVAVSIAANWTKRLTAAEVDVVVVVAETAETRSLVVVRSAIMLHLPFGLSLIEQEHF